MGYLRDLCAHIGDGRLNLDELEALPDEAVIDRLTRVKGSADGRRRCFSCSGFTGPTCSPSHDLGIVNAVHRLYKLRKRPDARRVAKIGEPWRCIAPVASWYLWQTLKNEPLARATQSEVARAKDNI